MNLTELNELDLSQVGSWPKTAKALLILFCCALVGGASYYLLIRDSQVGLSAAKKTEAQLKTTFESKAKLAANIPAYQAQLVELNQLVDVQLKQLPNTHEVAGLLDDISFIATDNGLQLNRINWEAEVSHDVFTELPMRIDVQGNYHQIGKFSADMAALPRIVILDSFTLTPDKTTPDRIAMSMLAKTYKYNEQSDKKAPEAKP
ncbi:MAG: type 4a pilus biogenesis protein PilO [Aeromonas sp.]